MDGQRRAEGGRDDISAECLSGQSTPSPLPAVSTLSHLSLVATAAAPSRLCEALFGVGSNAVQCRALCLCVCPAAVIPSFSHHLYILHLSVVRLPSFSASIFCSPSPIYQWPFIHDFCFLQCFSWLLFTHRQQTRHAHRSCTYTCTHIDLVSHFSYIFIT